ncbi:hypothetical protein L195_g013157 [Trifolium pratense]|uniref:Uncharacterized protein n=1 Tax=Trifolium pratense TaxID=57577 RepID=A0A2K3PMC5_TRIPR|nr:hypothetical protein L195_g013157 [Trifolium pratense]
MDNPFITTLMIQEWKNLIVAHLIDQVEHKWNLEIVNNIMNARDVGELRKMAITRATREDKRLWNWMQIWNLRIPQSQDLHMESGRGCFPTRDRLQQKGVQCKDLCPHCETTSGSAAGASKKRLCDDIVVLMEEKK